VTKAMIMPKNKIYANPALF